MFQDSFFLALPVTVLSICTFVVLFLAFSESDIEFGPALEPVQVQRNQCVALALDSAGQAIQLIPVQQ